MNNYEPENANPILYNSNESKNNVTINEQSIRDNLYNLTDLCDLNYEEDKISADEIFDLLKDIKDPEYSYTLENLKIIEKKNIHINHEEKTITLFFTPTIPNCSLATLIGLMISIKLQYSLSNVFKTNIYIYPGSHNSEHSINKQLNDKERIAAAIENSHLFNVIKSSITYNNPTLNI
uniref:Cytosolic iron-sulfur assembly component 2A n=1 Tax=Piliocolobus tephrosceles TaxID=591936 RepID=A0A8C9GCH8_9PRIM